VKVLLGGEYSRLHNSLKEGLARHGVEAHILATGDAFKRYPADFSVRPRYLTRPAWRWLRQGFHRMTGKDLAAWETAYYLHKFEKYAPSYDILQWINPYPFETPLRFEKKFMKKMMQKAGKTFLLACGDDARVNDYYLKNPEPYNIFTPFRENPALKKYFRYSLKYLKPAFRQWQQELESMISGIIPTDLDYAVPYRGHPKALPMIPNPVNTDKIVYHWPSMEKGIIIFHGINSGNYWRKGNAFFTRALEIIREKYKDKVQIIETRDLAYEAYIRHLSRAHIVLDQIYAWDQGYNALEAMAMGKVVFTGAEDVFREYYGLTEEVNINALPDVDDLAGKLSELIENPRRLENISRAARRFIEREHHYEEIAGRYLEAWKKTANV